MNVKAKAPISGLVNGTNGNGSTRKKIVWLLAGIIVLLVGGYGVYIWQSGSSKPTYMTVSAAKGIITDAAQASGSLEPERKVGLSFKNVGTISALYVKTGDRVTEGQVLAKQDTMELSAALDQAESTITQNDAALQNLQIINKKAVKAQKQVEDLFEVGVGSQADRDQAQDDYDKSNLDIISAQAQMANSRTKLLTAQKDLDSTKLVAPFAGIISAVNGDVGQMSGGGNGSQVNAFISLISDNLQLQAMVNEVDLGRVNVGEDVEFTSSAYTNKTFHGKVEQISPEATTVSNVQFYQVLISVEDPDHQLFPGMSSTVNVISSRKVDVVTVPMMALTYAETYIKSNGTASTESSSQKSSANPNQRMLLILQGDQPTLKTVTVGLSDGQNMEIVEGANLGDKVVIGMSSTTSTTTSTSTSTGTSSNQQQGANAILRSVGGGGGR